MDNAQEIVNNAQELKKDGDSVLSTTNLVAINGIQIAKNSDQIKELASASKNAVVEREAIKNQHEAQANTVREHAEAIKQQSVVKDVSTNVET